MRTIFTHFLFMAIVSIFISCGSKNEIPETLPTSNDNVRVGAFIAIASGDDHNLAIGSDGSIWAWGQNEFNQLGDGTTTRCLTPKKISAEKYVAVAAGYKYSLAIASDGTLWGWGHNISNQISDGMQTQNISTPKQIGDGEFIAISAGDGHMIALKADGTAWGRGENNYGQLCKLSRNSGFSKLSDEKWAAIAAGANFSLFLKADGSLWGCGENYNGQLGSEIKNYTKTITQIGKENFSKITAGRLFWVALKNDGSLWVQGHFLNDSLLPKNEIIPLSPKQLDNKKIVDISAFNNNLLLLDEDNSLWTWDNKSYKDEDRFKKIPKKDSDQLAKSKYIAISCGSRNYLALRSDDSLWGWGVAISEQEDEYSPGRIITNIIEIMEPLQLICTLDISSGANGTVSPSGTFSVNNGVNQQVTIKPNKNFTIDSLIVDGKKIDNTLNYNFNEIKNNHSLSVTFKPQSFFTLEAINKSNGVITPTKYDCDNSVSSYVFKVKPNRGYFIEKLLIDDLEVDPIMSNGGSFDSECLYSFKDISTSHTISAVFKKIPENLTFTTIGSGEKFVLGLTPAGDLWGHPIDGEKFNHPGYMQHFFAQKIDNNKYTNVFIDDNYDCNYFALSEDDSLYAWGGDSYRLPRNGSNRNIPQKVGRAKYSAISPSYKFAVAIKNENILCVWSEQNDKEIGLFSYSEGMPHVIAKGEFIAISTGSNHLLALGADGHLWAWGHNHNGQIGDNTTNACKVPKQIGNNTFVTIATGSAFSLALKTDGSLWAWGCNDKGQLGDGTTIDSLIPKKIGNDHFIAIATGAQHAIALKSDGKIFGWGLNIFARRDSIEDKIILNPKEIDSNSYLAISAIGNYATALRSDGSWWRWGPEMGFDYETKPHSDKKRAFTQILRIKKNKE